MTNTEKKMTKKDYFNILLAINEVSENENLVAFINHEIELLSRKTSGERKPSATQLANEGLKVEILEQMETGKAYTVSDMIKELACCSELSTSKVSSIVNKMVREDGTVEKIEEKRRSYFRKL